eukprot:2470759-Pleurochrysis_carterae.AAC.2
MLEVCSLSPHRDGVRSNAREQPPRVRGRAVRPAFASGRAESSRRHRKPKERRCARARACRRTSARARARVDRRADGANAKSGRGLMDMELRVPSLAINVLSRRRAATGCPGGLSCPFDSEVRERVLKKPSTSADISNDLVDKILKDSLETDLSDKKKEEEDPNPYTAMGF